MHLGMARPGSILFMIPYESDVGFAIERLARNFYDAGVAATGTPKAVHFAFRKVLEPGCPSLPDDFSNYMEFSVSRKTNTYLRRDPSDAAAIQQLTDYVESHRVDQVVGLDLQVGTPYCWDLRRSGIAKIVAYWGAPISSLNSGLRLMVKRAECLVRASSSPDRFIFESEAMREAAVFGRGVSRRRTTVIPTGVDVEEFRAPAARSLVAHELFGIPPQRKIVVFMGHLHKRKGVNTLLGAFTRVVKVMQRQDLHLLFLGNRNDETQQFSPLMDGDVAEYVTFGGYHDEIPSILGGCYMGCIPSTGWDSFPMSSLEMQACGLPVVVSDCQGVPETMQQDVTGMVVATGDQGALALAIAALANDPAARDRMGNAAARWIRENFSRELQVDRLRRELVDAFPQVVNSTRRRRARVRE
jgi:glycosyltransferase involved in cell wall biosynthesis